VLEIVILIGLCRRIGQIVRAKGHSAGWYQFMLVGMWFGGEIGGGFTGAVIAAIANEKHEFEFGLVYLMGLIGAIIGAVTTFIVAKNLPSKYPERDPREEAYFQPPPPLEEPLKPQDGIRSSGPPDDRFRL
jgi:hypothetical protein